MILGKRFEHIPFKRQVKLFSKQKERIKSFEANRDDLRELCCLICSNQKFTIISQTDRYGFFYPTGICTKCGHIQQSRYYTAKDIEIFYTKYYRDIYSPYGVKKIFDEQKHQGRKIANSLGEDIMEKTASVLEIGPGAGGILKFFSDQGKVVKGLDFDREYIQYATHKGIQIIRGGIGAIGQQEKFDLIILSHVLEHLDECCIFLKKIQSILASSGFLYIEVPSVDFYCKKVFYYDLKTYFSNAHISHFTETSLHRLLSQSGYAPLISDQFIRAVFYPCKYPRHAGEYSNKYEDNLKLVQSIEYKYQKIKIFIVFKSAIRKFVISILQTIGLFNTVWKLRYFYFSRFPAPKYGKVKKYDLPPI